MPLYKPKIPVCVAIGLSGVALAFQIAAVAGTGWLMFRSPLYSRQEGLFRVCDTYYDICSTYEKTKDWVKPCQAFSILALGAILGSLLLGILHFLREDAQRITLLAALMNVVAAVNVAVEVGVFAAKTEPMLVHSSSLTVSLGYGFYLSIVAGVLSVVIAILYVKGRVINR